MFHKPLQKPHPPLWQVVDSPSSIEWAAKNGIKVIMWIPPVQSLKKRFEIYQKAKSTTEKKHAQMGDGIAVVRDMFIADTMDQAREMAGEANGKLYALGMSLARPRNSYESWRGAS